MIHNVVSCCHDVYTGSAIKKFLLSKVRDAQGHFTSPELYELEILTNTEDSQSRANKKADVSLNHEKLQCSITMCEEFLYDLNMFLVFL